MADPKSEPGRGFLLNSANGFCKAALKRCWEVENFPEPGYIIGANCKGRSLPGKDSGIAGVSKHQLTRWERFYRESPHFVSVPPSACVERAAEIFIVQGCRTILDLGCGTGRDSFHLGSSGAFLVGLDAAFSGLLAAREKSSDLGKAVPFIQADARVLPFGDQAFDGVYCLGLLHEFVGPTAVESVQRIMGEIRRVLQPGGSAVVTAAAGDPQNGLPDVQNFTEAMFDSTIAAFRCIEKSMYDDLGCTGRTDYRVWFGRLEK